MSVSHAPKDFEAAVQIRFPCGERDSTRAGIGFEACRYIGLRIMEDWLIRH